MKKIFTVILSVIFISCTMTACGNSSSDSTVNAANKAENTSVTEKAEISAENTDKDSEKAAENPEEPDTMDNIDSDNGNHILVAYFSATGTTKGVAETLADTMSADLFEIVPTDIYTDDDLNYNDNNSRSTIEQNDKSARPEISNTIDDLSKYDTVFIGYPIWWYEEPRIMDTFVESYDFTDITVIPFCTSGGSGIGQSGNNLKELANSENWLDGDRLSGSLSESEANDWISSLGISVS